MANSHQDPPALPDRTLAAAVCRQTDDRTQKYQKYDIYVQDGAVSSGNYGMRDGKLRDYVRLTILRSTR